VTGAGKGEQFRFEVGEPGSLFRQVDVSCFEFGGGDRHPSNLVPFRFDAYDAEALIAELVDQSHGRSGLFYEHYLRVPVDREH